MPRCGPRPRRWRRGSAARPRRCYVASTGVIGERLPVEQDRRPALPELQPGLRADGIGARPRGAIMTTDTFAKGSSRTATIDGAPVTIAGIAKGSGMIAPDMATMLAFVVTDAALPAAILQPLLADATERSFNAITVDSDTSTSDTLLLFATGQAAHPAAAACGRARLAGFRAALEARAARSGAAGGARRRGCAAS